MEDIYCAVCGKCIPEGKLHLDHPKLNEHAHAKEIDFETWCQECHRSFYSMYHAWKNMRK